MLKNKIAFTLAEVLIVLGIIGIIADMTIPALKRDIDDKVAAVQLKKVYSTLSQAMQMAVLEESTADTWGLIGGEFASSDIVMKKLLSYLRTNKICGSASGCFGKDVKQLNGSFIMNDIDTFSAFSKTILSDGTSIMAYAWNQSCTVSVGTGPRDKNICGVIQVDINGLKKPNRMGYDHFLFWLRKSDIVPQGSRSSTFSGNTLKMVALELVMMEVRVRLGCWKLGTEII